MSVTLSGGAIENIMSGTQVEQPVLQVLGQKKIAGSGGSNADRYRLLLSDGIHSHSSAMLATQLNNKITSGELDTNTVIRLEKYLCNQIQPDRRVMILLDITIVARGSDVAARLGNPQPFKPGQQPAQSAAAPPAPAQAQVNGHSKPPASTASSYASPKPVASKPQNKFYGGAQSGQNYNVQNVPKTPGGTPSKVHPISSLTPYQNRWTIRARVTQKSSIRTWSNSRGEGKLFSMNLLDESGEIRATAFQSEVDKYYDFIEVNQVYYITKANLKTANRQYSSLKNDYEMTFNSETQVLPCEESADLPSLSFNFVSINSLDKHQANSMIDAIGVVKGVGDIQTIRGKQSNKDIQKRDVQLVDEGGVQVRLTLWGSEAESFDASGNPIMAVKGCRLSDWGGRSLSAVSSSQMLLNPDIPEAHRLRGWFDSVGHSLDYDEFKSEGGPGAGSATSWKTFADAKSQNIADDKVDYYTTKGTIVFMKKENCMYMACPTESCNKKLIDQGNGFYRCEKCQKEFPNYKWRLIVSANLADFSENQWATCFQETAEAILGRKADEMGALKDSQDESGLDRVFQEATFKSYIFRLRSKMETYNDENRMKTVCVQATPIDWKDYNKKLVTDIEKLLQS